MRISDWSSDVCSSDLTPSQPPPAFAGGGPDQELAAEAAITDQRGGAASDDSSNPCGDACSTDPCSYQSPSTIRWRGRPPTSRSCTAGRWVCPWMIVSTPCSAHGASPATDRNSVE